MDRVVNYIQDRIAFFIPLLLFAGYFKTSKFDFANWYLDLTLWLYLFFLIIQLSKANLINISFRLHNPFFTIFMPIAFMAIISFLLYGYSQTNTFFKVWEFLIITTPAMFIVFWVIRKEIDWWYLSNGVLLLGLYTSFFIFFNSIIESRGDISYLFSGSLTSLGGIIAIKRFFSQEKNKLFYFLCLFVCTVGVFVSYARGQQISYALIMLVIIFQKFFSMRVRAINKLSFMIVFFFISVAIFMSYHYRLAKEENVVIRFKPEIIKTALSGRLAMAKEALSLFSKNPLLGVGIGGYHLEYNTYIFQYPHNIILEIAAEFGLVGLFYFILIILGVFRGFWRFRQIDAINENLFLYMFIILTTLKEGSFFGAKIFWVWTALGLGLLDWKREKITYIPVKR